jgi:hypothetical protein
MNDNQVGFRLLKITTVQFAVIENAFLESEPIQLGAGVNYAIDEKNKAIACIVRFQFAINESPFLIIHVKCDFRIKDNAWMSFIDADKNEIKFPIDFVRHLAVLTVGTARGILHSKTENTKFNKYFLPTINVNELIKEGFSFKIENLK